MWDRPKSAGVHRRFMYCALPTFHTRLILNVIIVHLKFLLVLTINENIVVPIML